MKRDRQSVDQRRREMLTLVRVRGETKVDDLAEAFGISPMTVRRDLQALEYEGLVSRFHGGVRSSEQATAGLPATFSDDVQACRQQIARYAAGQLRDGDRVFINGSNTALMTLEYVGPKGLCVYTNNANGAAHRFPEGVRITFLGGELRGGSHIMTGDCAMRNLLMLEADVTLLGCTGISPDGEILCDIPSEIGINETMVSHGRRCLVLADHTKVGRRDTHASCSLEKSCTVVTDALASEEVLRCLRARGMEVVQL